MDTVLLSSVIVTAIVAGMVGFVIAQLLSRSRLQLVQQGAEQGQQQLMQLQQQYAEQTVQLQTLQQQHQQLHGVQQGLQARLEEKTLQQDELKQQLSQREQQYAQLQQTLQTQEQAQARLTTTLQKEREHTQAQLTLLASNKEQLKQEFNQLAQQIFDVKREQFTAQNQQQLDALLKPFQQQLHQFRQKVDEVYVNESKDRASLKSQIEALHKLNQHMSDEASNLTRALKGDKKMQGNWGELHVAQILESSGLIAEQEYYREANFKDEEGANKRPDFVVKIPGDKHLIIDSKVSLNAYLDFIAAEDESSQQQALKRHITNIEQHIQSLSQKSYPELTGLNSPDFVLMFMPIEPAFMAAFQHKPQLFNTAFEQRIIVVTPTTLLATLRTVANIWSIERQNANARKLADQASKLHDKLRIFVEKMEKLDGAIQVVRQHYEQAMTTLTTGQGNIISQTKKFEALGVRVKKELPASVLQSAELEQD